MGERKLENLDRTKIIDLWITQRNVDKLKERLNEEEDKLQELIRAMTNEELTLLMDSFYEKQIKEIEADIPEAIVFAIHELADREDKELNQEDFPF